MKNKFPGMCSDCGKYVLAGQGVAWKGNDGWEVRHEGCEEKLNHTSDEQLKEKTWLGEEGKYEDW